MSPSGRLMLTSCLWRVVHHPLTPGSSREQLTSACPSRKRLFRKDNIPLHVIFKRAVKINVCPVKLRGFPDWQKAITPAFGHHLGHLFSCPQGYDKGVWPTPIKLRSPDHFHLGCWKKKGRYRKPGAPVQTSCSLHKLYSGSHSH